MAKNRFTARRAGAAARENGFALLIDTELQRLQIAQASRFPAGVLLLILVLATFVGGDVVPGLRVAWGVLLASGLLTRWQLARMFMRAAPDDDGRALRRRGRILIAVHALTGLAAGVAIVVWFPALILVERALVTVAYFAWYAGVVVVSLVHPLSAYLFGMCLLGPLCVAWAREGGTAGLVMAIITLLLLFSVRQSVGDSNAAIRDAIRSRLREAGLVRSLEEHSREVESAMRSKTAFLAAASHDLRQPVTSLSLLVTALHAAGDERAMRTVADKLDAPLQALEEILSSLVELSRLDAGSVAVEARPFVPADILEAVAAEYRPRIQDKGLRLELSGGRFSATTDPELLKRVLRNLVDNAVKYTDRGGIGIEARAHGPDLQIEVADTGRGIAKESLPHVFDDYFQGDNPQRDRRQGLGLGLSIVRRLVGLLHGRVEVDSEVGEGTTFVVTIEGAVDQAGWFAPAKVLRMPAPLDVDSVLVVEDDRLVIDGLAAILAPLGIDARYATDAQEAMSTVALGRFMPDAALVDFGLPGGMDGIALIETLRARMPHCRFLLVTGDTRPEIIQRAQQSGITIVYKPLSVNKLADALRARA